MNQRRQVQLKIARQFLPGEPLNKDKSRQGRMIGCDSVVPDGTLSFSNLYPAVSFGKLRTGSAGLFSSAPARASS